MGLHSNENERNDLKMSFLNDCAINIAIAAATQDYKGIIRNRNLINLFIDILISESERIK